MNNLDNFLSDLNDTELAIFIAYRFDSFLESSRKKILLEAKRRQLTKDRLTLLFKAGLPHDTANDFSCPQCHSTRYHVETEYEMRQNRFGVNVEIAIDTKRCRICGFNPAKNPQKGLINKIKQALGFYEETRLKRPEIDGRMFN